MNVQSAINDLKLGSNDRIQELNQGINQEILNNNIEFIITSPDTTRPNDIKIYFVDKGSQKLINVTRDYLSYLYYIRNRGGNQYPITEIKQNDTLAPKSHTTAPSNSEQNSTNTIDWRKDTQIIADPSQLPGSPPTNQTQQISNDITSCQNLFENGKLKQVVKDALEQGWHKYIRPKRFDKPGRNPIDIIKEVYPKDRNKQLLWFLCSTCKQQLFPSLYNSQLKQKLVFENNAQYEKELSRFLTALNNALKSVVSKNANKGLWKNWNKNDKPK